MVAAGHPYPNGYGAQQAEHQAGGAEPSGGAAGPAPGPAQQQRAAGAVGRLVSPPFGGSDWDWLRFWLGWLVAPGVLVALQVVGSSSHEPWFVVHVAWLGERAGRLAAAAAPNGRGCASAGRRQPCHA